MDEVEGIAETAVALDLAGTGDPGGAVFAGSPHEAGDVAPKCISCRATPRHHAMVVAQSYDDPGYHADVNHVCADGCASGIAAPRHDRH